MKTAKRPPVAQSKHKLHFQHSLTFVFNQKSHVSNQKPVNKTLALWEEAMIVPTMFKQAASIIVQYYTFNSSSLFQKYFLHELATGTLWFNFYFQGINGYILHLQGENWSTQKPGHSSIWCLIVRYNKYILLNEAWWACEKISAAFQTEHARLRISSNYMAFASFSSLEPRILWMLSHARKRRAQASRLAFACAINAVNSIILFDFCSKNEWLDECRSAVTCKNPSSSSRKELWKLQ